MPLPNGTFKGYTFNQFQSINSARKKEIEFHDYVQLDEIKNTVESKEPSLLDDQIEKNLYERVIKTIKTVKHGHILLRRHGLGCYEQSTLAGIGKKLNKSTERVRQMEAQAIMGVREQLDGKWARTLNQ